MSEPTTLRESIESALDKSEPEVVQEAAPAPEPVSSQEVAPSSESSVADSGPSTDLDAMAEAEADPGRERDESGRFKSREAQEETPEIQPGPKAGPNKQDRAPASWRPDMREHWGAIPEPVRAEIQRREVEVQRTLQESAEARKGYDAVMKTIAPYEHFIRAENSNPLQAIQNLMGTAATLRVGTPAEKAGLVAGLVKQYGIDINMLDSALAGQPVQDPQQTAIDQVINQRLAPVQQMFQQFQQAQMENQQRQTQAAYSEVEQFLSRAEFGNDVRQEMADLIESAARRGENLTLQDAYKKACLLNDNVRAAIGQRMKSRGLQNQTQAAQRARSTAVSVTGAAPVGAMKQDPTDIRSSIEAAIAASSR